MIRRLGQHGEGFSPDSGLWDLCIVGAGAAGLALAAEFLGTSSAVIVLESGLWDADPLDSKLNELCSEGLRHDGWREGRLRGLGGTTRAWGGQLVPMMASELQERPWIPGSGWPLTLEQLDPYYRRVEQLLKTEGPPYDQTNFERLRIKAPEFDRQDLRIRFSQWTALGRRNFAVRWRRQLEKSRNVTVLLDATAMAVRCPGRASHCESVEVRSRSGAHASIHARAFVIASGGLETARLLLASPLPAGGSVANSSGLVGRYFQDHVSFIAGTIRPAQRRTVQALFDPRYAGGTMFSVKVEPTERAMRSNRWLHAMAHVAFQIPDALGWMEVRRILRSIQAGRLEVPSLDEALAMLRGAGELTRLVLARALSNRRRSPDAGSILLLVDCEQAPNPDSRVYLDHAGGEDPFGMPRLRLDWRLSELEHRTLTGFARRVAQEFERLGLGQVELARDPDFALRDCPGAARDIFHHMGTTRMSLAPSGGVTDPNLRCHDVDNLYIAGPSVFPASGVANPTFTAVALTLRLADHLKSGPQLAHNERMALAGVP